MRQTSAKSTVSCPLPFGRCLLATALLLCLCAPAARALDPARSLTQYVHRIWQMQQGLPEATIYAIGQTTDGFLWLGTQSGVVRFDGVRFTQVHDASGAVPNLWVRNVLADNQNGLWIATDGAGLLYLKDGATRQITVPDSGSDSSIHALLLDRHGTLWATLDHGLMTVMNGAVKKYGPEQGLSITNPRALCETSDGRILVGGEGPSVDSWDGSHFERQTIASLPASASVHALLSSEGRTTWIASSSGLVRIKDQVERRFTTSDGLPNDSVDCLSASEDGSVYAGTRNGFVRIRGEEVESFGTRESLSQSTVYSLFLDREGSLWVGTKHGLNQLMDRRTVPFTATEGLASNNTGPVFEDASGGVWVGTLDAGLSRFDGQHFSTTVNTSQGLSSNTVYSLAADQKDGLWVGTDAGLNHVTAGKADHSYTMAAGLPSNAILCILHDSHQNLWVGTSDGLARLEGERFVQPQDTVHASILALAEYHGQVIAATSGGALYTVAEAGLRRVPLAGQGAWDIDALCEDSDGQLWLGSRGGGLLMFDGSKTHSYTVRDGLYDDDIYGIVQGSSGRLWFACSKGIFNVSRDDLRKFTLGQLKTLTSTPFSPLEGLRTIECKPGVQPAAWATRDGKAWFSTIRGALMMDTAHPQRKLMPAPVVVEDAIVNGTPRSPAELSELPPGQSNLEFRYTALSFIVPTRITFKYQLEGFDHDWVDAGTRREAFYTNLRPGTYHFRVRAENYDNTVSQIATPVTLTLQPYFYQRHWFLPVCIAALLWAAWFVYRRRVKRIRQRLEVVLTERSRIARELHDTLMQGFSGITMEMQALSARLPDIPERGELNGIISEAGTCLREARQSIAGLRTPRGAASGLAASIEQHARQVTEARDVRLKLKLDDNPPPLPAGVEYNLLRIAQEAVTNSVKHANARVIEVSLDSGPQLLRLSIKDDGSGLSNGNGRPGHYGLIGMRERAAQIGAAITIDSEAGRGTVVSVLLPTNSSRDEKVPSP